MLVLGLCIHHLRVMFLVGMIGIHNIIVSPIGVDLGQHSFVDMVHIYGFVNHQFHFMKVDQFGM
jgi:hypothetical protein